MNIIQRLFGKKQRSGAMRQPSERPPDWRLTISDLMEELRAGKRKSVGQPEREWALEYERSLIPAGVRFPQKGDVYESLQDQPVSYLTAWAAPFTGDGKALLLKGERVWIHSDPRDEKPIGTYALPVEYRKMEQRMVQEDNREDPRYNGFYFYFETVVLNDRFKLVKTGYTNDDEGAVTGP